MIPNAPPRSLSRRPRPHFGIGLCFLFTLALGAAMLRPGGALASDYYRNPVLDLPLPDANWSAADGWIGNDGAAYSSPHPGSADNVTLTNTTSPSTPLRPAATPRFFNLDNDFSIGFLEIRNGSGSDPAWGFEGAGALDVSSFLTIGKAALAIKNGGGVRVGANAIISLDASLGIEGATFTSDNDLLSQGHLELGAGANVTVGRDFKMDGTYGDVADSAVSVSGKADFGQSVTTINGSFAADEVSFSAGTGIINSKGSGGAAGFSSNRLDAAGNIFIRDNAHADVGDATINTGLDLGANSRLEGGKLVVGDTNGAAGDWYRDTGSSLIALSGKAVFNNADTSINSGNFTSRGLEANNLTLENAAGVNAGQGDAAGAVGVRGNLALGGGSRLYGNELTVDGAYADQSTSKVDISGKASFTRPGDTTIITSGDSATGSSFSSRGLETANNLELAAGAIVNAGKDRAESPGAETAIDVHGNLRLNSGSVFYGDHLTVDGAYADDAGSKVDMSGKATFREAGSLINSQDFTSSGLEANGLTLAAGARVNAGKDRAETAVTVNGDLTLNDGSGLYGDDLSVGGAYVDQAGSRVDLSGAAGFTAATTVRSGDFNSVGLNAANSLTLADHAVVRAGKGSANGDVNVAGGLDLGAGSALEGNNLTVRGAYSDNAAGGRVSMSGDVAIGEYPTTLNSTITVNDDYDVGGKVDVYSNAIIENSMLAGDRVAIYGSGVINSQSDPSGAPRFSSRGLETTGNLTLGDGAHVSYGGADGQGVADVHYTLSLGKGGRLEGGDIVTGNYASVWPSDIKMAENSAIRASSIYVRDNLGMADQSRIDAGDITVRGGVSMLGGAINAGDIAVTNALAMGKGSRIEKARDITANTLTMTDNARIDEARDILVTGDADLASGSGTLTPFTDGNSLNAASLRVMGAYRDDGKSQVRLGGAAAFGIEDEHDITHNVVATINGSFAAAKEVTFYDSGLINSQSDLSGAAGFSSHGATATGNLVLGRDAHASYGSAEGDRALVHYTLELGEGSRLEGGDLYIGRDDISGSPGSRNIDMAARSGITAGNISVKDNVTMRDQSRISAASLTVNGAYQDETGSAVNLSGAATFNASGVTVINSGDFTADALNTTISPNAPGAAAGDLRIGGNGPARVRTNMLNTAGSLRIGGDAIVTTSGDDSVVRRNINGGTGDLVLDPGGRLLGKVNTAAHNVSLAGGSRLEANNLDMYGSYTQADGGAAELDGLATFRQDSRIGDSATGTAAFSAGRGMTIIGNDSNDSLAAPVTVALAGGGGFTLNNAPLTIVKYGQLHSAGKLDLGTSRVNIDLDRPFDKAALYARETMSLHGNAIGIGHSGDIPSGREKWLLAESETGITGNFGRTIKTASLQGQVIKEDARHIYFDGAYTPVSNANLAFLSAIKPNGRRAAAGFADTFNHRRVPFMDVMDKSYTSMSALEADVANNLSGMTAEGVVIHAAQTQRAHIDIANAALGYALGDEAPLTAQGFMPGLQASLMQMGQGANPFQAQQERNFMASRQRTSPSSLDGIPAQQQYSVLNNWQPASQKTRQIVAQTAPGALIAGMAAGSSGTPGVKFWGGYIGAHVQQQAKDGYAGYNANQNGFLVGGSVDLAPEFSVGAYGGWASGLSSARGIKSEIDSTSLHFGGFFRFKGQDEMQGLIVTGDLAWSSADNRSSRTVPLTAGSQRMEASYGQYVVSGGLEAAYDWMPSDEGSTRVTPYISGRYSHLNQNGYTESGAIPLKVGGISNDQFTSTVGVRAAHDFLLADDSVVLTPRVNAAWMRDWGGDRLSARSNFVGSAVRFDTKTPVQDRDAAQFGLGLDVRIKQDSGWDFGVKAAYGVDLRASSTGHNFFGGLEMHF